MDIWVTIIHGTLGAAPRPIFNNKSISFKSVSKAVNPVQDGKISVTKPWY
jgi:hypothetical protein